MSLGVRAQRQYLYFCTSKTSKLSTYLLWVHVAHCLDSSPGALRQKADKLSRVPPRAPYSKRGPPPQVREVLGVEHLRSL